VALAAVIAQLVPGVDGVMRWPATLRAKRHWRTASGRTNCSGIWGEESGLERPGAGPPSRVLPAWTMYPWCRLPRYEERALPYPSTLQRRYSMPAPNAAPA
jgi:hypothetical protein